ncbi:MAG: tRNA lysidine(34) synthetase TilS [Confluentibacter sp.]|nr:tRNA lysidine(34) synthetase TilS [Confluentibacter sp.]HMQ42746.1 tRNA lysidine(34) synthetase TilS [Mariniflexile sp.]
MQNAFQDHINAKLPFLKKSKLLIAISGGMDSVVLARLCHNLGFKMALAHCNFNLRGNESDADEHFVLQLAEDLDLEVFVESFDTNIFAEQQKLSIQMAARKLRYDWFEALAEQLHFDYVLTAHHADDNLETFLINLTRGTGLEGLTGIPEVQGKLVRPLLPFSRETIEAFAKKSHFTWRDDTSNASTKYVRNKLRHYVIPVLKQINPSLLLSFQNTMNNLNDTASIVNESIKKVSDRAVETLDNHQIKFKISEFKKLNNPKAYLFELLKAYGFTEWNDVANLLNAQSGKQVFSETWRLIKDRNYLLLSERPKEIAETMTVFEADDFIDTPFGTLFLSEVDAVAETGKSLIFVDKEALRFPLTIRKWQKGDVFYPAGMTGKKKLSKYFKDEKFSLLDKENTWLLCTQTAIVWVIGKRADNRFRVTEHTKQILKIELT